VNNEQIVAEFSKLIEEGRRILKDCGYSGAGWSLWPSNDDYFRVRTRASNLVRRACGENSAHRRELESIGTESLELPKVVGVLEAAKADFEGGFLFDLKALVEAEILGDFLDQATALIAAGHHVAAASLTGAVLEDTLRKMSDAAEIPFPASTKIDSLNIELAKAAIYDKLTQKQITAWADIRNNADHGHFDKVKKADVDDMIKWVQRFASEHLR
jgi:hypothetical protein